MTTTFGVHTLCFWNCILVSVSELYHRTRRGPRSFLIISIAALRYYCTISYLRMAERCTIKSTYIHLDGHATRGVEDLVSLRALAAWCSAWHGCRLFDMLHGVFVGEYPLTHTDVYDAPVFYSSMLCSHCLGISIESAAMIPILAQSEHNDHYFFASM